MACFICSRIRCLAACCCSVLLQRVVAACCCSVLCLEVFDGTLHMLKDQVRCSVLQHVTECFATQFVAVSFSVLPCVALCRSLWHAEDAQR